MKKQPFIKQYSNNDTEFYTTEESVLKIIPYLDKTKKYIEPFNRKRNSKIYSILRDKGFDICSFSKDYSETDDYDERIVITNPPFISRFRLYSKLSKQCDEMYLIMPSFSFNCYTKYRKKDNCKRFSDDWKKEKLFDVKLFDTPNGPRKINCVFSHWKLI